MKLTRLRVAGFKTFVEATEIAIEPGLTGIVGPNGCGKSNLVEALRWAMGESSHKSMRAGAMDEVIFGGSSGRPARNTAEVILAIDNADRLAPAAFNGADRLEVARRIEREHGSSYRVNGREVRARDVQLLFADAATGARSPALVRQGQVAELIAAKPQARRRILEDAAGVAGLGARRAEAELRLRGAEDNLARLDDVLREIEGQADALRRQRRQAARYRALSAEIRRGEALLALLGLADARSAFAEAEEALRAELRELAARTAEQAAAARDEAVAAQALGPLRDAEAASASAIRRLTAARHALEGEERRVRDRLAELARRIAEAERDAERAAQVGADAAATLARLGGEAAELTRGQDGLAAERARIAADAKAAEEASRAADALLAGREGAASDRAARRKALVAEAASARLRAENGRAEARRLGAERDALAAAGTGDGAAERAGAALAVAEAAVRAAEEQAGLARAALGSARAEDGAARHAAHAADRDAARLDAEHRTVAKLLAAPAAGRAASPVIDRLTVSPGLEAALAAALRDDGDASDDPASPSRWTELPARADDPALPPGVVPLDSVAAGVPALARRLRQVGLVSRAEGAALQPALRAGQLLVSREGDLWRWDGFVSAATAPSPTARRLAERHRMGALEGAAFEARARARSLAAEAAAAAARVRDAAKAEAEAVENARRARAREGEARAAQAAAERAGREQLTRLAALGEAILRVSAAIAEAEARAEAAAAELAALGPEGEGAAELAAARAESARLREATARFRAEGGALDREAAAAERRRAALAADLRGWTERAERAASGGRELATRLAEAKAEQERLREAPDALRAKRRALAAEWDGAEARRQEAADALAAADRAGAEAGRQARAALAALTVSRERRAGAEARAEALAASLAERVKAARDAFGVDPHGLQALAGLPPGGPAADRASAEARLAGLRAERERLGGVNLRAEEELAEAEEKRDRLRAERDDLQEAIKRLRSAIAGLNREGRERLLAAFGRVDGHFRRLFGTLFGGGEAELSLIESDDPLEAGLEIVAKPPGKKPQSLLLLSGGEQALTATALIFAVFLTNPSPICVLDEVDAPLDDSNVERYCDLLRTVSAETDTRFLVITHNPITMARMDRLFGVTMAELGVSQVVSVDLDAAERLREAS